MEEKPLIFVVVGTFGSGKDTVGEHLSQKHGMIHISSSDIVRAEAQKRYGSIERHVLLQTANELRTMHGPHVLGQMSYDRMLEAGDAASKGVVISGLRNVDGVQYIKDRGGHVVYVDAPIEVRYERMQARQRDAESTLTLEEFQKNEEKELESGGPNQPNILAIKDIADFHLMNDTSLEAFAEQIEAMLETVRVEDGTT